ncbi:polyamine oxidase Fms1p [Monosporozyma servazzii]
MSKRVIVIGAGISGLKAASTLYANDIKDVKVFEARNRIGGRLRTVTGFNGKQKYDLGASWHHDTLCNELFDEEVDLKGGAAPFIFDDDFNVYIDKERGRIDKDPDMRLEFIDREIEKFTDMQYHQRLDVEDMSFFQLISKFLFEKKQFLTDDQIRYAPQICRFLELWHGFDWKSLSAKETYFGHQGRNALVLNFDAIIKRIAQSFPEEWIQLDTSINSITRKGKEVVVTTSKGETHVADYVIVTIPQSVLELSLATDKQIPGRIEFTPPLNKKIVKGLNSIHVGSLGKMIFEFQCATWDAKHTKIVTLAQSSDKFARIVKNATDYDQLIKDLNILDQQQEENCWNHPFYFINFAQINGTPSFMMLMQEPVTKYIESLNGDKNKIFEYFQPILDKIMSTFGSDSVVNGINNDITQDGNHAILKNILSSSWTSDPYSRGSYTACKPGDDGWDMILAMNEGQDSRIRFAGEHTIMDGAGSVNGAWASGRNEADYVVKQTL